MATRREIWERPLDTMKTGRSKNIPRLEGGSRLFELKIGSVFAQNRYVFPTNRCREGFGQVRIRCAHLRHPVLRPGRAVWRPVLAQNRFFIKIRFF